MDFRLRVFKVVAEHLNFTKASKVLGVSQPAVTKHIQELEGLYQIQLFDRAGGKISLTHQGALFLEHTNTILAAYSELMNEMELLTGEHRELRIGTTPVLAQYILPSLTARFMELFPNVRISIIAGSTKDIEENLENGTIDLGIMEMGIAEQDLKSGNLTKERLSYFESCQLKVIAAAQMNFTSELVFVSPRDKSSEITQKFISFALNVKH